MKGEGASWWNRESFLQTQESHRWWKKVLNAYNYKNWSKESSPTLQALQLQWTNCSTFKNTSGISRRVADATEIIGIKEVLIADALRGPISNKYLDWNERTTEETKVWNHFSQILGPKSQRPGNNLCLVENKTSAHRAGTTYGIRRLMEWISTINFSLQKLR